MVRGEISSKAVELFVPGRLCLFGEHSDWAGSMRKYNADIPPGLTLVVTTVQGLYATARKRPDKVLVLTSTDTDGNKHTTRMDLTKEDELGEMARQGGFWCYAAGTAYKLAVEWGVGGLELDNHTTTLPLKRGLSSSAAFCVLLARAYNQIYGLGLTVRGEMAVAYEGERLTPSQCGRMDQAVAFGKEPILMGYDGDVVKVESASLACPLHLVLVNLRASKDTVAILHGLQAAYPHPETPEHERLTSALGAENLKEMRERVLPAMRSGDAAELGLAMVAAQNRFDAAAGPLCPEQLGEQGSPALHRVLAWPSLQPHILGGKGVGSQGDGTAQLLCRDATAQQMVCALLNSELGLECVPFTVPPTTDINGQTNGLATCEERC